MKKDLVFIHVHRTGGSTCWHSMAPLAVPAGWPVCDLYYQGLMAYQTPTRANDIIWAFRQTSRNAPHLFHHHTDESVRESFDPARTLFATMLRDPIDRVISLVQLMRNMLPTLSEPMRTYHGDQCGPEFCELLAKSDPRLEELIEAAITQPFFRNYYVTVFRSMCHGVNLQDQSGKLTDKELRTLADDARNMFAVIGWFGRLQESYAEIVRTFGLSTTNTALTANINRTGAYVLLSPWHRKRYYKKLEAEYALVEYLGVRTAVNAARAA